MSPEPRQGVAQAADGVFDPAFLPWGAGIAEEGLHAERMREVEMAGEFLPVQFWIAALSSR